MSEDFGTGMKRCYVGSCDHEGEDLGAVEEHIRQKDDYAHRVTAAFLPGGEGSER